MNTEPFYDDDFDPDNDGDNGGDVHSTTESGPRGSFEDFYNSFELSSSDLEHALVDAVDEEDSGGPSWTPEELAAAACSGLPDPRKGNRRVAPQQLSRVTEEDFEPGGQRSAFVFVRHFATHLCGKKSESLDRVLAARWLFSNLGKDEVTFELCCTALKSRADVVRLRLQFELWNRWVVFSNPIPRIVVPVPEILFDDIQNAGGWAAHHIAQIAWEWPGIPTETLLLSASGQDHIENVSEEYLRALNALDQSYILSGKEGRWWLTGRNPIHQHQDAPTLHSQPVYRGKSVTFSELFS